MIPAASSRRTRSSAGRDDSPMVWASFWMVERPSRCSVARILMSMRSSAGERFTRSPPGVDQNRLAVLGAHDLPVPVGLAADHDDVDILFPEHRDQLVVGPQVAGMRLLAVGGARIDVVLHQLQVPIAPGRDSCGLMDPADQLRLLVE